MAKMIKKEAVQKSIDIAPKNEKWNTLAIIGFICAFLVNIVGLILSIIALVQIHKSGEKGKGLAIAGIIISALQFIIIFIIAIAAIIAFGVLNPAHVP